MIRWWSPYGILCSLGWRASVLVVVRSWLIARTAFTETTMPSRAIKIIIIAIRNTWKIACRIHFLCKMFCKMKDSVVVQIFLGHEHEEWCLCSYDPSEALMSHHPFGGSWGIVEPSTRDWHDNRNHSIASETEWASNQFSLFKAFSSIEQPRQSTQLLRKFHELG